MEVSTATGNIHGYSTYPAGLRMSLVELRFMTYSRLVSVFLKMYILKKNPPDDEERVDLMDQLSHLNHPPIRPYYTYHAQKQTPHHG